jgi:hypothetical protein
MAIALRRWWHSFSNSRSSGVGRLIIAMFVLGTWPATASSLSVAIPALIPASRKLAFPASCSVLSAESSATFPNTEMSRCFRSAMVLVTEKFAGQTAWEGIVEVFILKDHPKATCAYAWMYRDGNQNKALVVLKIPPVDSSQTALKVAIASKATH